MDDIKLWRLNPDQTTTSLHGLPQLDTEWQLEELIVRNPDLLEPGIAFVGRQTPAAGGWLDLLGVDGDGRLVVFELKRGGLGRDAVAQVLDYASALTEMDPAALGEHISERSGSLGIAQIEDFQAWYEDRFGDLQRLFPIRMALVGLGIDQTALRIARFLERHSLDVQVITLFGFQDDEHRFLARGMPVQRVTAPSGATRTLPIEERRRLLALYLEECGLTDRFNTISDALRERLHSGAYIDARKSGISIQMDVRGASGVRGPRPFFGLYAAYTTEHAIEISLNSITRRHNPQEYEALAEQVELIDWPHGGQAIIVESDEQWGHIGLAVCEFARAVYQSWLGYRNTPMDHSIVD